MWHVKFPKLFYQISVSFQYAELRYFEINSLIYVHFHDFYTALLNIGDTVSSVWGKKKAFALQLFTQSLLFARYKLRGSEHKKWIHGPCIQDRCLQYKKKASMQWIRYICGECQGIVKNMLNETLWRTEIEEIDATHITHKN